MTCRAAFAFRAKRVECEIAVSQNGGQKIIEIVRNSARELAERFHFLRTQHLILQLFARGDIHERTDKALRHAGSIADNQRALEQVRVRSVRATKSIFSRPMFTRAAQRLGDARRRARAICGMNFFLPETDVCFCVLGGVAEQAFQALRPGERAASYIPNPNRIICSPRGQRRILSVLKRCSCK